MNLNFRGLDPKIASKIHAHRIEHGHPNLTATLECIIKQWDEQRDYIEEHNEELEVTLLSKLEIEPKEDVETALKKVKRHD